MYASVEFKVTWTIVKYTIPILAILSNNHLKP